MDSKQWGTANSKKKSQEQPSPTKAYTVAIDQSINKALKQVDFKSRRSGNGSGSGEGLSARSDMTCHKCDKKGYIKKDCRSKVNGSGGNPPKNSEMIFHNGLLISLLSQIPNILQQPPCPATTRSTSGAHIAIVVRVHGDFTRRMSMRSEK